MGHKVLVIEDDDATADYIVRGLEEAGFSVDRAATGRDGLFLASEVAHECIILDRLLPELDGMAILTALRAMKVHTPVLFLSALGTAEHRVEGLTAGSDDYLSKPFSFAELLARVNLLIRKGAPTAEVVTKLSCGNLEMDLLARTVRRGETPVDLQPREFRLLEFFLRHPNEVVTRTMLLESVWDYHFDPGTNVIDVHISRLRRKIEPACQPPLLHTVRGAGYRLAASG